MNKRMTKRMTNIKNLAAKPWTREEDDLIAQIISEAPPQTTRSDLYARIAHTLSQLAGTGKGLYSRRTPAAIQFRVYKLGLLDRESRGAVSSPVTRAKPMPDEAIDLAMRLAEINIANSGSPNWSEVQAYLNQHAQMNNLPWDKWSTKTLSNCWARLQAAKRVEVNTLPAQEDTTPPEPSVSASLDIAPIVEALNEHTRLLARLRDDIATVSASMQKLVDLSRLSNDALEEIATRPAVPTLKRGFRDSSNMNGKYGGTVTGPDSPKQA